MKIVLQVEQKENYSLTFSDVIATIFSIFLYLFTGWKHQKKTQLSASDNGTFESLGQARKSGAFSGKSTEVLLTFTCLIPRVKQFPSHPTPEVDNLKCPVQCAFDGDVRRMNQCCFYVYRWAINCARSIMKRSCRSCCERTLVRALPPSLSPPRTQNYCLFSQFRMEVPPSNVYSPCISVHAKTWVGSWNPLNVK